MLLLQDKTELMSKLDELCKERKSVTVTLDFSELANLHSILHINSIINQKRVEFEKEHNTELNDMSKILELSTKFYRTVSEDIADTVSHSEVVIKDILDKLESSL